MKIVYFSKTIAAYDFKVGRCIELYDLITYMSIKIQGNFNLAKGHSLFKLQSYFPNKKTFELFETKYHVKDFWRTEMKLCTKGLVA